VSITKIDWADYSINPIRGYCPVDCKDLQGNSYCYARKLYDRYHWDKTIRFVPEVLAEIEKIKKPSRIFIGSTIELFGEWVNDEWMDMILFNVKLYPQHRFIFLSKQPYNLGKWKFPDNAWVGISTTGNDSRSGLEDNLKEIKAKVKFVSIEPLLDYTPMDFRWVNWVICGRQTPKNKSTEPHVSWLLDIAECANKERVPLFLKNNLKSLLTEFGEINTCAKQENRVLNALFNRDGTLRQEYPNV
jgi:protein gp37